jgi:hypothetical protein
MQGVEVAAPPTSPAAAFTPRPRRRAPWKCRGLSVDPTGPTPQQTGYRPRDTRTKQCLDCVSSGRIGGGAPRPLTALGSSGRSASMRRRVSRSLTPDLAPAARFLRWFDDEHGEVHLGVVVLGVEDADDTEVRLVRAGVDHGAGRPVRPPSTSPSLVASWKCGTWRACSATSPTSQPSASGHSQIKPIVWGDSPVPSSSWIAEREPVRPTLEARSPRLGDGR